MPIELCVVEEVFPYSRNVFQSFLSHMSLLYFFRLLVFVLFCFVLLLFYLLCFCSYLLSFRFCFALSCILFTIFCYQVCCVGAMGGVRGVWASGVLGFMWGVGVCCTKVISLSGHISVQGTYLACADKSQVPIVENA